MAFSGGTFNRLYSWVTDALNGINITASRMDQEMTGMAVGLSTCILKDGSQTISADIPFNSKKITQLASGTALTDAVNLSQLNGALSYLGSSSGTNTITAAATPALPSYSAGQVFAFIAGGANTGATTININSLGAKNVFRQSNIGPTACVGGEIASGQIVMVSYDGTQFQIINSTPSLIGEPKPWAASTAPAGFLLSYGQAISRTTYAALFSVIATTYGTGDGSTTFNLPDMRGRAVFGQDNMGGSAANRVTNAGSGLTGTTLGAVGGDQLLPSHTHSITDPGHHHAPTSGNFITSNGAALNIAVGGSGSNLQTITANSTTGITATDSAGSGVAANMPPAIIMNYIIKV